MGIVSESTSKWLHFFALVDWHRYQIYSKKSIIISHWNPANAKSLALLGGSMDVSNMKGSIRSNVRYLSRETPNYSSNWITQKYRIGKERILNFQTKSSWDSLFLPWLPWPLVPFPRQLRIRVLLLLLLWVVSHMETTGMESFPKHSPLEFLSHVNPI